MADRSPDRGPADRSTAGAPATARGDIALGWYLLAFALYVAGGYVLKSVLLNWIVGPLFLLIVLYIVPAGAKRLASIGRRR